MSEQGFQFIAIGVYFAAMIAIGVYASRQNTDHEDYMLGGRSLSPTTAALSAGASDMSGWLMMGLPGALFATGLIEAWIAIGLTIGAYLNWKLVAPRLRAYTEVARNSITIPSFLENRLHDRSRALRVVSGLVILVFFTFYISSGMVAGGVFFESSIGSNYLLGMVLVSGVTLLYTLFGGFLGASLTDVVQGLLMMVALLIIPMIAVVQLGGLGAVFDTVVQVDPQHLNLFPSEWSWPGVLAIVSALGWGLGYFGQPHIIVRFMAMKNPASATRARWIGISWMVISLAGAVVGGLVGLAYVTRTGITLDDPETLMLTLAQILLHPLVAGFVLAAVLAAIMSTLSSQLIVCSSAVVEDLYRVFAKRTPSAKLLDVLGRTLVVVVAIVAALMAIEPSDTILTLVSFAWAGFGASFGPVVLLALYWRKLTNWGALAGMVVGATVVFVWSVLGTELYELVPGFAAGLLAAVVVSLATYRPDAEIDSEFDAAVAAAKHREPVAVPVDIATEDDVDDVDSAAEPGRGGAARG